MHMSNKISFNGGRVDLLPCVNKISKENIQIKISSKTRCFYQCFCAWFLLEIRCFSWIILFGADYFY